MTPAVLDIVVEGIPQTKGSWRSVNTKRGHRLIPDNPDEAAWAQLIAWTAKAKLKNTIALDKTRRYSVNIDVVLPPRIGRKSYNRDADKVARSVLDALTKIVWFDDEQVDCLHVYKQRGDSPGAHIIVWDITP